MRNITSRRLRSAVLFLVGLVVGAVLVAPYVTPSGASAVTTHTRSVSCAGGSFFPTDSATDHEISTTARIRTSLLGSGVFRCDPGLPHGGVVTQVRFTLVDVTNVAYAGPCSLKRHSLLPASSTTEDVMASVINTQFAPGVVRTTDSSIAFPTIDASRYVYWLECALNYNNPFVGIVGADVTFTITAAKG